MDGASKQLTASSSQKRCFTKAPMCLFSTILWNDKSLVLFLHNCEQIHHWVWLSDLKYSS